MPVTLRLRRRAVHLFPRFPASTLGYEAVNAMETCLVLSARLNGHDPWAYLRDVLQRLACLNFVE